MNRVLIAAALAVSSCLASAAFAKDSTSVNRPENKEIFASIGDSVVRVKLRESLPNAFGRPDIFGRKRDRGFVEITYMGLADDGRAIFRRRNVDVYSNETTMTRSQPRFGTGTVTAYGDTARFSTFTTGSDRATVQVLPPDTIEIALDLSKNRVITIEDRAIEVLTADGAGVKFLVRKQ